MTGEVPPASRNPTRASITTIRAASENIMTPRRLNRSAATPAIRLKSTAGR